jgi:hypothetical protein
MTILFVSRGFLRYLRSIRKYQEVLGSIRKYHLNELKIKVDKKRVF